MKRIDTIPEERHLYIRVIIAAIPRRTLQDFKEAISDLTPEELKYLKRELSMLVAQGDKKYWEAYNSL